MLRRHAALLVLVLLLAFALVVQFARAWPQLPARVPAHFGLDGQPDAFRAKAGLLVLPAVSVALAALAPVVWRWPEYSGLPASYTLRLVPEPVRGSARDVVRELALASLALAQAVLLGVAWGTLQVATGASATLPLVFVAPLLLLAPLLAWGVLRMRRLAATAAPARQPGP